MASVLPSWVPDWSCREHTRDYTFQEQFVPFYDSRPETGWSKAAASFELAKDRSGRHVLATSGVLVDTLEARADWNKSSDDSVTFHSFNGYTVFCTSRVQISDQLWVLRGSYTPFILRTIDDGYMLVSSAQAFRKEDDGIIPTSVQCSDTISQALGGTLCERNILIF